MYLKFIYRYDVQIDKRLPVQIYPSKGYSLTPVQFVKCGNDLFYNPTTRENTSVTIKSACIHT